MAASTLPKPGTKYGPCGDGCTHRDCGITRRMAGEVCRFCDKAVGYDVRFFTDPKNTRDVRGDSPESGPALVHADCLEDDYDRENEAADARDLLETLPKHRGGW